MSKTNTITIQTRELAAVAKWASTDRYRPNICMVLFGRGEYVATDGHRLVRVPCETNDLAFGIDRDHLLAACAAQENVTNMDRITLEIDGSHVKIRLSRDVAMAVPLRDPAGYPPIEQVIPTGMPTSDLDGYILDARYLAAIYEVNAVNSPGSPGVKAIAWSPMDKNVGYRTGAILFENVNGVRFVIMPMKAS